MKRVAASDSTKVITIKSWNDVAELLEIDEPPKGSMTALQFAEREKMSVDRSRCFLHRLAVKGLMNSGLYRQPSTHGRAIMMRYYWPKK